MLPQTAETRDVACSLFSIALSHIRSISESTTGNRLLAHSIVKLCLDSKCEHAVGQHLTAMKSSLQTLTSANKQLSYIRGQIIPLFTFISGLIQGRSDRVSRRLRTELTSLRGVSLGIGLNQFLMSYREDFKWSHPLGLGQLDHETYYATIMRSFVDIEGGLAAFFHRCVAIFKMVLQI